MGAAVEAGRRVFIRPLTAADRDELLALNRSSQGFLRPWVQPMLSRAAFAGMGYMREGFSRRDLKFLGRWRDHERWAITAEDRRR